MVENVEHVYNIICSACLCVGRKLGDITSDRLREYYHSIIKEIPLNVDSFCPYLCWECTKLLEKGLAFREQIKDSYRILQTYSNEDGLLTEISRPPRLKIIVNNSVSIPPTIEIDLNSEEQKETVFVKSEENWDRSENELKEEQSDYDDFECLSDDSNDKLVFYKNGTGRNRKPTRRKKTNIKETKTKNAKTELNDDDKDNVDIEIPKFEVKEKSVNEKFGNTKEKDTKKTKKKRRNPKKLKHNIKTIELTQKEIVEYRNDQTSAFAKAIYKCNSCLLTFRNQSSKDLHYQQYHDPNLGDYVCPICKTVVTSTNELSLHYMGHLKGYECGDCGKKSHDKKTLRQHYARSHLKKAQYTCELCGKISNTIDSHKYHRDTHRARIQCPQCDKTFRHRVGLANHTMSAHEEHNQFPCEVCGKVLRWKSSLKKHMETHQATRGVHSTVMCEPCGVSFVSSCSLRRHLRNSLKHVTKNELRFICDPCGARYSNKTKLRDHIEEKHLHRTYQCNICLKPSKNRVTLDQHIRNVHRGRPHNKICHHCGKGFPTQLQLDSHIRSHTGEKPFICEYCPSAFSQHGNLHKHYRQVHQDIKSKRLSVKKESEIRTSVPSGSQIYVPSGVTLKNC